jgi:hypothetical protein
MEEHPRLGDMDRDGPLGIASISIPIELGRAFDRGWRARAIHSSFTVALPPSGAKTR